MTRSLECRVALLKEGLSYPLPGLLLEGKTPADRLVEAAGPANLQMATTFPSGVTRHPADVNVGAVDLHNGLYELLGNLFPTSPATSIGLLLSDVWPYDDTILGVMFDTSFGTEFTPGGTAAQVPREGCAVFLDAIRAIRPVEQEYARECFFISVHELGHVFNLWHDQSTPNFLQWPDTSSATGPGAFCFTSGHKDFLSNVASAEQVYPGGKDFGKRHPLALDGDEASEHLKARASRQPLRLLVRPSQYELAYYEPLELDIEVVFRGEGGASSSIPSRLDPGFDEFVVWIECPDGTRRPYRPLRRYCGGSRSLTIGPDTSFSRDLSVFVEAGGFTLRSFGEHRVWASYRLPDGSVLRSDAVSLDVRGQYGTTDFSERVGSLLTRAQVVRFLYHRNGRFHYKYLEAVAEVSRRSRDPMLKANLYYALGRYYDAACRRVSSPEWKDRNRARARSALSRALDLEQLSVQRRRNALQCLEVAQYAS